MAGKCFVEGAVIKSHTIDPTTAYYEAAAKIRNGLAEDSMSLI
jgi:hypothetical protein